MNKRTTYLGVYISEIILSKCCRAQVIRSFVRSCILYQIYLRVCNLTKVRKEIFIIPPFPPFPSSGVSVMGREEIPSIP